VIQDIFNKSFDIKNLKIIRKDPFNELVIEFLDEFSEKLKSDKNIYNFPDLIYLMFWTRKKELLKYKNLIISNELRVGRGLAFHICPSNVPTNFFYSFIFGLLSGNSNLIKMPSIHSEQKKIILNILISLFKLKKFKEIKETNNFIEYDHNFNDKFTSEISLFCDARIVWGSDQTINKIAKFTKSQRAIDLFFPDRYSITSINLSEYSKLNENKKMMLANRFFYDAYSMNQNGCNSPHFLFWVGKKNKKQQKIFWDHLNNIIQKKFNFKDIEIIEKYLSLLNTVIKNKKIEKYIKYKNNIYVIDASNIKSKIEDIRGLNGIFFEKNILNLGNLKNFISKKCQTMSYFGFHRKELEIFVYNNNIEGIDRMVPIGESLNIDLNWDGFDVIKTLSRIVALK